jgi:signal peptidase II
MKAVPANRYAIFFSLAILGCLVDLATKSWVFNWLGGPGDSTPWWIIEGVFGFQTSLNEGALFGMGQGFVHVFSVLSLLAAAGILYWLFVQGAALDLWLTIALGSITGGILGNLYDRLGLPGLTWQPGWILDALHQPGDPVYAVRDWIKVVIIEWPWPNFNIADSMLVCGAILLVWHAFRRMPAGEQTADPPSQP